MMYFNWVILLCQSSASIPTIPGWIYGWTNGVHTDVSTGHGASENGCNPKGNVRSSYC